MAIQTNYKSSLYCWIVLTVFIAGTMIFMTNFYNRAVDEISHNSVVTYYRKVEAID